MTFLQIRYLSDGIAQPKCQLGENGTRRRC